MPPRQENRPLSPDLQAAMEDFRQICKESKTGSKAYEYGSQGYKDCIRHFLASSSEVAQLAVRPRSTEDLSKMMKVLSERPTVPFAVKSGGHAMVPGASSTTGIMISMSEFDGVEYNHQKQLVKVGAGCLWDRVYSEMSRYGRNVVGGAASQGVGVGGWLLGAGYSLKSNQYGLGIDNVIEFEVVVPDGRVLKASEKEETRLYQALRLAWGGGNNFGIVTSFVLKTHWQTKTYGGSFVVPGDRAEEAKVAIADFVANEDRTKAVLVAAFRHRLENGVLNYSITFMCVYDGPKPEDAVFQQFKDLMASGVSFSVDPAGWESGAGFRPRAVKRAVANGPSMESSNRPHKAAKSHANHTAARVPPNSDWNLDGEMAVNLDSPPPAYRIANGPATLRAITAFDNAEESNGGSDDPFHEMDHAAADAMFTQTYAYEMPRASRGVNVEVFKLAAAPIMQLPADSDEEEVDDSDENIEELKERFEQELARANALNTPIDQPIQIIKPTDSMGESKLRGRFGCIMVSRYTKPLLDKMAEEAEKAASYLKKHRGNTVMIDAWPVHAEVFKDSPPGAAWPHAPDQPMGPCLAYFLWENEEDNVFWLRTMKRTLSRIRAVAHDLGLTPSNPAYYNNLSLKSVPVKNIYRENMEWLMEVKKEYDPLDVMGRTGVVHKIPLPT